MIVKIFNPIRGNTLMPIINFLQIMNLKVCSSHGFVIAAVSIQ